MSRGQKRRVPANFPRMKYRARKRRAEADDLFWPSWAILSHTWEINPGNGQWKPLAELMEGGR